MFELPHTKMFMDTVHGYIHIPKIFVEYIIDTDWFQRLRYIDQTGMKILYPNGKHDRFSHSLGVYHLGLKSIDALLMHFKNQIYWNIRSDNTCDIFWAKNKVLFLIACLLHDIGHAPFSHSLEKMLLDNSTTINMRLLNEINSLEQNSQDIVTGPEIKGAAHERIGALLVIEKFKDNISCILNYLHEENYPVEEHIRYAEYAKPSPSVDSDEINADIAFIARMILGLKYKDYRPEKQIRNCFIELLNGSNFDVDKLDYIIRDTKMSGISNTMLDVERLIGSLTLVTTTKYVSPDFNSSNGLFDKKAFIAGFKMDSIHEITVTGTFDGIFHLKGGTVVTIYPNTSFLSLKAPDVMSDENRNISNLYLKYAAFFSPATELYIDNQTQKKTPNRGDNTAIVWSETGLHTVVLKNATVLQDPFDFQVADNRLLDLEIKGNCHLRIKGEMSAYSFWFQGELLGSCSELTLVNDYLIHKNYFPVPNQYNGFTIGFKKQAINLIANVLDARDYLYLWIYAHHKVVYYANFLIPTLTKTIVRFMSKKRSSKHTFPCWKLNYDDIRNLDDNYLLTAMKYIAQHFPDNLTFRERQLLDELFSRKYKKSLYKSLAEYDILFSDFTIGERQIIRSLLGELSSEDSVDSKNLPTERSDSGYIDSKVIHDIEKVSGKSLEFIQDLVWVDANYNSKKIDFENTFCVFPEQTVTMKKLDLLSEPFKTKATSHYFYIYYEVLKGQKDHPDILKQALQIYFREQLSHL